MFARAGSAVAPLVRYLGVVLDPNVPPAVYGSLAVTSGLLVLLLPETKNRLLPETLEDGENFGRKEKSSSENPQKEKKASTERNKEMSAEV